MVSLNSILCWISIIYSIYMNQAAYVAAAGFAFLLGIGGYYMHVGHADLKATMAAINPPKNDSFDASTYNGPAMPEPGGDDA